MRFSAIHPLKSCHGAISIEISGLMDPVLKRENSTLNVFRIHETCKYNTYVTVWKSGFQTR